MAILVTGGAGYIGSHTVLELINSGEEVIVIDNLEKGHKEAVLGGKFYRGDLQDTEFLKRVFAQNHIDAVVHFAAHSLVGESMQKPLLYYEKNVLATRNLLEVLIAAGIKQIVFSSTAAVYGEPQNIPIMEKDRTLPTNPYGETKLAIEKMLYWAEIAYGLRYISLRYFNATGADEEGRIGEDHQPETHLIPKILEVALGKADQIMIFGEDYPTLDGTCIRDYIHVTDLAQAHIRALDRLRKGAKKEIYNLGNGTGYSVKEVLDTARQVTGHPIPAKIAPRREGDPAILVASYAKAQRQLGWHPHNSDLAYIIETAWNWHKKNPDGYGGISKAILPKASVL